MTTTLLALALGFAAGMLAGMFGVGGGLLFVPTLVALGLGQVEAGATSLAAILPTAVAGTWRQRQYGNVDMRSALVIGVSSVVAVQAGVVAALVLPEHVLQRLFAVLILVVAGQLVWRARDE